MTSVSSKNSPAKEAVPPSKVEKKHFLLFRPVRWFGHTVKVGGKKALFVITIPIRIVKFCYRKFKAKKGPAPAEAHIKVPKPGHKPSANKIPPPSLSSFFDLLPQNSTERVYVSSEGKVVKQNLSYLSDNSPNGSTSWMVFKQGGTHYVGWKEGQGSSAYYNYFEMIESGNKTEIYTQEGVLLESLPTANLFKSPGLKDKREIYVKQLNIYMQKIKLKSQSSKEQVGKNSFQKKVESHPSYLSFCDRLPPAFTGLLLQNWYTGADQSPMFSLGTLDCVIYPARFNREVNVNQKIEKLGDKAKFYTVEGDYIIALQALSTPTNQNITYKGIAYKEYVLSIEGEKVVIRNFSKQELLTFNLVDWDKDFIKSIDLLRGNLNEKWTGKLKETFQYDEKKKIWMGKPGITISNTYAIIPNNEGAWNLYWIHKFNKEQTVPLTFQVKGFYVIITNNQTKVKTQVLLSNFSFKKTISDWYQAKKAEDAAKAKEKPQFNWEQFFNAFKNGNAHFGGAGGKTHSQGAHKGKKATKPSQTTKQKAIQNFDQIVKTIIKNNAQEAAINKLLETALASSNGKEVDLGKFKKVYYKCTALCHPDKVKDNPRREEQFKLLNNAYHDIETIFSLS